jgi:hypothetical protein
MLVQDLVTFACYLNQSRQGVTQLAFSVNCWAKQAKVTKSFISALDLVTFSLTSQTQIIKWVFIGVSIIWYKTVNILALEIFWLTNILIKNLIS